MLMVVALIPAVFWNGHPPVELSPDSSARFVSRSEDLPVPPLPASPSQVHHETPVADPKRIVIPTINLTADIVPLGIQPDGSLATPGSFSLAGWYTGGAEPGEPGPSVIVGHVDSHLGPAVFFRLRELAPGQPIVIETANGATLTFFVERIEQYAKERFPADEVYGPTSQHALRLITCGGKFDRAARNYRDNIVVFARLAA
jgi:hypothetical protein